MEPGSSPARRQRIVTQAQRLRFHPISPQIHWCGCVIYIYIWERHPTGKDGDIKGHMPRTVDSVRSASEVRVTAFRSGLKITSKQIHKGCTRKQCDRCHYILRTLLEQRSHHSRYPHPDLGDPEAVILS
ncbi:hypothetical protein BS47DRAFT_865688 [Hydnum rufescens UP504]|uniref:Uncharacterized protein n=1 Tax=Hydnum rufescens UP504 TaxID=1448309 RepID=A0A9P6DUU5_9AGAM|nr:hypothetical protein BS47DRAFT_865688 [Hydnum rufescens UP504]